MLKSLLSAALLLATTGLVHAEGAPACPIWEDPSVLADNVLIDLKAMLEATRPA